MLPNTRRTMGLEMDLGIVLDALSAMVWTALPDGRIDFLNRQWLEYAGVDEAHAQDWQWEEAVSRDDLPELLDQWSAVVASGEPGELTASVRRFDGQYRRFVIRASPLRDATGQILRWCGVASDVEDFRHAREALEHRELDFQLIVDSIPAPVAVTTPTGDVEGLNQLTLDYFGKTLEELKCWKSDEVVHPDDLESTIAAQLHAHMQGTAYNVESRHRRADGIYRWYNVRGFPLRDEQGHILRWFHLLIDIDDRKRAEIALAESERNLNQIINAIPAQVWSARLDGSAEYFNQYYLDYVGRDVSETQDWGWTEAVHPDDVADLARLWKSILARGMPGVAEARLRRHDGPYRWFLFRASPLRDTHGNIVKWYGVNTDIDDRKRAEEALNKARSELVHVARVMSMGTLTASIAHEVNQPLSGIVTNASTCLRMLAADPPNVEGARETARRTIRDGNRAADVIGRLRALFSKRCATFETVDLNAAAREVIALLQSDLDRARVILRTEFADLLPCVGCDRVQVQQVIMNLLRNAADSMANVDSRPRYVLLKTETEAEPETMVRLTVQDSGVGFDPQDAERLFDTFYTTKTEGMGIGLAVSRSIIESHRGRLWASTRTDGPGASFAFSIPACD